jgi:hypothetical protein
MMTGITTSESETTVLGHVHTPTPSLDILKSSLTIDDRSSVSDMDAKENVLS